MLPFAAPSPIAGRGSEDGFRCAQPILPTPIGRYRLARVKVNNALPICVSLWPSSLSS
jgi:hypothetical protein